jgi:hypothetical protein
MTDIAVEFFLVLHRTTLNVVLNEVPKIAIPRGASELT